MAALAARGYKPAMTAPTAGAPGRRLWDRPYLLLLVTTLLWAGNSVAGRLAVGHVSPMMLTASRWMLVLGLLGVFMRRPIAEGLPILRANWKAPAWMGALGFTAFNALFYQAAHETSAVNISILQGAVPALVMVGALVLHRTPVRLGQALGILVALTGVATIASQGRLSALLALRFNRGDLFMAVACVLYAAYTLGLRGIAGVSSLAFFAGLAAAAFVTALPLAGFEIAAGRAQWPDAAAWAILAYIALAPSLVSQVFFMRAVELIGPGRAGLFVNLVPVFAPLLA
ncbi:MAG: DMT family transporter, partial [Phenylobacterium sp.]